jgi:hypothetical protein
MRPETGAMKFGDDWRGTFFRGDDAFHFSQHLKALLDRAEEVGEEALPGTNISVLVLRGLQEALESVDERKKDVPTQVLKVFDTCLVEPPP